MPAQLRNRERRKAALSPTAGLGGHVKPLLRHPNTVEKTAPKMESIQNGLTLV